MAEKDIKKTPLALKTKAGRRIAQVRAIISKDIEKLQVEGEGIAAADARELDKRADAAARVLNALIGADDSPYDDSLLNYDIVNAAVMVEAFAGTKAGKAAPHAVKKLEKEFVDAAAEVEELADAHREHLDVLYG